MVFAHYSRDGIKQAIEAHGGKNVSSISSKTDYVLAGDKMGPEKRKKAESLGIPIITEADFEAMINDGNKESRESSSSPESPNINSEQLSLF